jgi:hypothetical protein
MQRREVAIQRSIKHKRASKRDYEGIPDINSPENLSALARKRRIQEEDAVLTQNSSKRHRYSRGDTSTSSEASSYTSVPRAIRTATESVPSMSPLTISSPAPQPSSFTSTEKGKERAVETSDDQDAVGDDDDEMTIDPEAAAPSTTDD